MDPEGWIREGNVKLQKNFQFKNFNQALQFINRVGELAEKFNHHPDIYLHNWNRVRLTLSTHSVGEITEKDGKLAAAINALSF